MNEINWTEYFLLIAENVKLKSKDKSTQIGAVIVGRNKEILSTGYNSFPRGLNDNLPARQDRPEKYYFFEHAERNAIYNAARVGTPIEGASIFITSGPPCADCARGIINAGIKTVYCKRECTTKNKEMWGESQKRSLLMFQECGVDVVYY
jgi:dCMP deaminase